MDCEICKREMELTEHHLIPKTRHLNKKTRKNYSLRELKKNVIMICRPCHDQLHKMFDGKQLEREFNTLDKILANEKIQGWIKFIEKKPIDYKPKW